MKDLKYLILIIVLFIFIFSVFLLFLYNNIRDEVLKDDFVKTHLYLKNVSHYIAKGINLINRENIGIKKTKEVFFREHKDKVFEHFIKDYYLLVNINDSVFLNNNDTIVCIDKNSWDNNIISLSGEYEHMQVFGYNLLSIKDEEIKQTLNSMLKINNSFGFFQTKKYIVNYIGIIVDNNKYMGILNTTDKKYVFKEFNIFILIFSIVLFLLLLMMMVFIVFYIEKYSLLLKKERETEKRLEFIKINKLLGIEKFASIILHDINNPLTSALGFMNMLKTNEPEIARKYHIEQIIENLNMISKKTRDTLDKTRREFTKKEEKINLNDLIINKSGSVNMNIEVKLQLNENIPLIKGILSDFSMVLGNLIDNAVDSMYDTKKKILTISTDYNDKFVYVKIEDTGTGIPDDIKDKIFDLFFTTKEKNPKGNGPKGTGIGLYSIKNAIENNNAKIHFDTKIGQGTIFTITIPY